MQTLTTLPRRQLPFAVSKLRPASCRGVHHRATNAAHSYMKLLGTIVELLCCADAALFLINPQRAGGRA